MKLLRRLAIVPLCCFSAVAFALPVLVSQTLTLQSIAPFGIFSGATYLLGGWSVPFPFTSASQIQGITWSFATEDADFNDQALWPTDANSILGRPGVELSVIDDSSARQSLASFVPGNQSFAMNLTFADGLLVRSLVSDGLLDVRLGAFDNFAYPNPGDSYSTAKSLDAPSTLTITLRGEVPGTAVPEPDTLALLGAVLLAGAGLLRFRRAATEKS